MEFEEKLQILRKAGKIHKEIREWIKPQLQPGVKLFDIAHNIETRIREATQYCPENPLKSGIAFPTGLSRNECAAHWSPHYNSPDVLNQGDILKVDFGIHFNGLIIDAAFTHTDNPKLQVLVDAAYEATNSATKAAGPDAVLGEIGKITQEVISSFEFNDKPLTSIQDLCGHSIGLYRIHNNKCVPNIHMKSYALRMKPGEFYAIETFPSTGTGHVSEVKHDNSHFMVNYQNTNWQNIRPRKNKDKRALDFILKHRSTMAFCPRWFHGKVNYKDFQQSLEELRKKQILNVYPPLCDIKGSYTSQYEQTIAIKESGIEILS